MIDSLLDTDLYKLTMQAVIAKHFPDAVAEYTLNNRTHDMKFNRSAFEWLQTQILALGNLRFSSEEVQYLQGAVPFLPADYLKFLATVRLNPAEEVQLEYDDGCIDIRVRGLWKYTILYEIPILALASEAYFKFVDTKWNYDDQELQAFNKCRKLLDIGCSFSEFGTRRRRSKETQRLVIKGIILGAHNRDDESKLIGTSNVMFAKEFGLKPVGTVAHELMMGIAAYDRNYLNANKRAMDVWLDTVGEDAAGFALTDTFGTPDFLRSFVPPYSDLYAGVRQDSGDPVEYTKLIGDHYKNLGYKPNTKIILYSDSLNIERCAEYKRAAEQNGLIPLFGIGTFFTNDFRSSDDPTIKSKPLNIVIKISSVNGVPAIKLSDNISKNTGPADEVKKAKIELGYTEKGAVIDESNRW